MPEVIRIHDENDLSPASDYPLAKFPFAEFNPVQSSLLKVYDRDANFCIASATSSGKTICAEMLLAHAIRKEKKKGLYVAPLKSLSQEKIDDWTNPSHHFAGLNISICTGDYVLTPARKAELERADLIIMTSEMLASRTRNIKSEKNTFLKETNVAIIDEAHLLTVPGRGDHLEVALMKLTEINKDVRIGFLSATMSNVTEICEWLSRASKRDTYFLESKYRPCPLTIHYVPYAEIRGSYDDNEEQKIVAAERIVDKHPNDKFLIFAHTKRTGNAAKKRFQEKGYSCEFHNADLKKETRRQIEADFKSNDPKSLRVLIATSTMSWGVNTSARRVIILGTIRGMIPVEIYDIIQMIGRAGRVGWNTEGDAYILLPDDISKFKSEKVRLTKPCRIESQLLNAVGKDEDGIQHYKTLAFHVVSEIHKGNIRNRKSFYSWFSRSLASFQSKNLDECIIDNVVNLLVRCGAIREDDGNLSVTAMGTVASMLYYSPFDVSDFKKNFGRLFSRNREGDLHVAMALADIDSFRYGICSRAEREEMSGFHAKLTEHYDSRSVTDGVLKAAYCYYHLLSGKPTHQVFHSANQMLKSDFDRTVQVLNLIDQMGAKWSKKGFFETLKSRVHYGLPPHLVPLSGIPNVGAARAKKLYDAGIRSVEELAKAPKDRVGSILNMRGKMLDEIMEKANP